MWLDHLILFLGWLLFYGLHSLMATEKAKSIVPIEPQLYRLFYNAVSLILFFVLLFLGALIPSYLVFAPSGISNYSGLMLAATGLFVIKRAFRNYNFKSFMGLKKNLSDDLKKDGLQSSIRHPLYTGTLLIVIGYFLFNPQFTSLTILLALTVYLPLGIFWEEKKLIKIYGEEYLKYRQEVPALFPKFKLNK